MHNNNLRLHRVVCFLKTTVTLSEIRIIVQAQPFFDCVVVGRYKYITNQFDYRGKK